LASWFKYDWLFVSISNDKTWIILLKIAWFHRDNLRLKTNEMMQIWKIRFFAHLWSKCLQSRNWPIFRHRKTILDFYTGSIVEASTKAENLQSSWNCLPFFNNQYANQSHNELNSCFDHWTLWDLTIVTLLVISINECRSCDCWICFIERC